MSSQIVLGLPGLLSSLVARKMGASATSLADDDDLAHRWHLENPTTSEKNIVHLARQMCSVAVSRGLPPCRHMWHSGHNL